MQEHFPQFFSHKPFRTIDDRTIHKETRFMARYSAFLGSFVDVQYRAGDICLPASGTLVADSGRSIFLEQHYEQHGQPKNFRWEIPYQCIVRLGGRKRFASRIGAARATGRSSPPSPRVASQCSASLCRCFPASRFSPPQDCLSLPDPKPPDSRTPGLSLDCPRFCRAECIRGWTFRSDIRRPTSGFSSR